MVSKVDQSIKDLILELLDEADELLPIGSLSGFKSDKKTLGYSGSFLILFFLVIVNLNYSICHVMTLPSSF